MALSFRLGNGFLWHCSSGINIATASYAAPRQSPQRISCRGWCRSRSLLQPHALNTDCVARGATAPPSRSPSARSRHQRSNQQRYSQSPARSGAPKPLVYILQSSCATRDGELCNDGTVRAPLRVICAAKQTTLSHFYLFSARCAPRSTLHVLRGSPLR